MRSSLSCSMFGLNLDGMAASTACKKGDLERGLGTTDYRLPSLGARIEGCGPRYLRETAMLARDKPPGFQQDILGNEAFVYMNERCADTMSSGSQIGLDIVRP